MRSEKQEQRLKRLLPCDVGKILQAHGANLRVFLRNVLGLSRLSCSTFNLKLFRDDSVSCIGHCLSQVLARVDFTEHKIREAWNKHCHDTVKIRKRIEWVLDKQTMHGRASRPVKDPSTRSA